MEQLNETDTIDLPNYDLQPFETDPEEDSILENFLKNTEDLDNYHFVQQKDHYNQLCHRITK